MSVKLLTDELDIVRCFAVYQELRPHLSSADELVKRVITQFTEGFQLAAIFDADNKVLAVISKEKKESLHMLAKLNEFGDPQTMKIGKRSNGKDYAEERKTLETFYEYYVENAQEVKDFINMFAINADSFDYNVFFKEEAPVVPSSIVTV